MSRHGRHQRTTAAVGLHKRHDPAAPFHTKPPRAAKQNPKLHPAPRHQTQTPDERQAAAILPGARAVEVEAFPIGFTKGIRSHWRRRKYQRLENGDGRSTRGSTQRLGGGGARRSGGGWRVRLRGLLIRHVRVVRAVVAAPGRVLCRLRDAYVGGMLAVSRKAAVMAVPGDGVWAKRVPRRKHQKLLLPGAAAQQGPSEFEKRLVMEIYKSIVASKELTTMLHSSTAHVPATTASYT